jgi:hypothetical protein
MENEVNIVFLHHSTGLNIWLGGEESLLVKLTRKLSNRLSHFVVKYTKSQLPELFNNYNSSYKVKYNIEELTFPKSSPYGWKNYPYDYYNIWVKNAGEDLYKKEPTLEILTKRYQIIIFKHCFPVSNIQTDEGTGDIDSEKKTISNYKLQYQALKNKLHDFPDTKFILFTGAAQTKSKITEEQAHRAREFFNWVLYEWDLPNDNIFIWDLYTLQTEGNLYLNNSYAVSASDPHPNKEFAGRVVKLLFNRIIDVAENNGNNTLVSGEKILN